MITLIIADDHALVTDSLRIVLENDSNIRVIATAYDGKEALEKCRELKPDIVLLDINMPNLDGISSAKLIKASCPNTKVALLTLLEDSKYVLKSLAQGVDAYLLKDTPPERLKVLIQCIHWGYFVLSESAFEMVQSELFSQSESITGTPKLLLKQEDLEIIRHISEGKSNREIGDLMGYAEGTIKNKLSRIIGDVNVDNRAQLVVYALKNGLI